MPGKRRNYKLNHSRDLDLFARQVAEDIIDSESNKPTMKQLGYYKALYARCKENNISTKFASRCSRFPSGRTEFGWAIGELRKRLKEAGIDPGGNDKLFIPYVKRKPLDLSTLTPEELVAYNAEKTKINQMSIPYKEKKPLMADLDAKYAKDGGDEQVIPFWATLPNGEERNALADEFVRSLFESNLCADCGGGYPHHYGVPGDDVWFAVCKFPPSQSGKFDPIITAYRNKLKSKAKKEKAQ